ncbi:MAG: hypothetical protein V1776_00095 [Candidatus Diapherotrites archaeon]
MHYSSRGVLFTFLTFLFIGVLLGLVIFSINSSNRFSQTTIEVSILNAINAKYDDITDDIITLDQSIGFPSIQQRILPFSYLLDMNRLTLTQTLPISSGKLSLYLDLLNAYRIFIEDQNATTTFDGVSVDFNVPQTSNWGGTHASTARFNILPQCMQYYLADSNTVHFNGDSVIGCANFFSLNSIDRITLTISLPKTTDDYNMVSCTRTGGCVYEDYNANKGPYFQLFFLDENCTHCSLSASDKNIAFHFNEEWGDITYSCVGGACNSQPIMISLGNGLSLSHAGEPIIFTTIFTFKESVSNFYFQDANYSVQKEGFRTYKSNVVVFPK